MSSYRDVVLSLIAGASLGFAFAKLKLPIPAPPSLAGIMGVVGVWLGFLIAHRMG